MGPIGCPETSVQNYRSKLRNIAEERRSQGYMTNQGKIDIGPGAMGKSSLRLLKNYFRKLMKYSEK
jgi:hypothetical protein